MTDQAGTDWFILRDVEKLAHSREGLVAAYRAGMILQEKGWMMYPAAGWKDPAILAFVGDECVAGLNVTRDEDDHGANVGFAWCSPDHPMALVACLLRLRRKLREDPPTWLSFTCHKGNKPMEKLVTRLKLEPHSMSYRVPKSFYERRKSPKSKRPFWSRLKSAAAAFRGSDA